MQHTKRVLANGSIVIRDWLLFSPSKQVIFCFVCRLFGNPNESDVFSTSGFSDWRNVVRALKRHENSSKHIQNDLIYRQRRKESNNIDKTFVSNVENDMRYWRSILQRIIAVIKFLGSRGLAFRGSDQIIGSKHNGNFLGIIELISEFDPLLSSHLSRYGNQGKGEQNISFIIKIHDSFLLFVSFQVEHRIFQRIFARNLSC